MSATREGSGADLHDHPPSLPVKPRRFSAGVLLYRLPAAAAADSAAGSGADPSGGPEVLLGHMGGPLWAKRDAGAWSIPKGGYTPEEDAFAAARREYVEEVGLPLPDVPDEDFVPLGEVLQANNKVVTAWAVPGDVDPAQARSALFELEWPPNSGRRRLFPEFDRVAWFTVEEARPRIVVAQAAFLDRLVEHLQGAR